MFVLDILNYRFSIIIIFNVYSVLNGISYHIYFHRRNKVGILEYNFLIQINNTFGNVINIFILLLDTLVFV